MIETQNVKALVDKWLEGKEYFLTDLTIDEQSRIVVEIDHKDGVWIEDCVELSRYIEANLDREVEDYELEVGSAGLGQPFKVLQQYYNNVGTEVEVITNDNKKLQGVLKAASEGGVTIVYKAKVKPEGAKRPKIMEQETEISFGDIKETRSVIKF